DAHGDLVVSLTRKFEDPAAREEGRRIALSNGNFPFGGQLLGPGFGLTKGRHAVAVRASPLRPILGREARARETNYANRNGGLCSHFPPRVSTEEVYNTCRRYFVVRRRANPRMIIPPPRNSMVAGSGVTVT